MWMWTFGSGFLFTFMLFFYVAGRTADGLLIPFVAVWFALMLIRALVPREKPDEMSEAAYNRATRWSHTVLFAAMWLLLLLFTFDDKLDIVVTKELTMLLVSGALFAACFCRACVFAHHARRGFEDD